MSELAEYFEYKCYTGLEARGLADKPEYQKRLKYEIEVISKMGFQGYFLIVQDFINWAKSNDIYVGPGRGSAAGSLVSYCLGITGLDPIKWDLMFERFLNPARISMPDIDIDIEKRYRERVLDYVVNKYGTDYVAHIGTYNLMRAKAAVRAVCRTLGHPYQIGDDLAKLLLPPIHGKPQPLKESIARVKELNEARNSGTVQSEILKWAEKVEDLVSSIGVHASGIVISNEPLSETVPLFHGKHDEVATQWEMGKIEDVGLIKFDFLGLDALTKIHQCIDIIKARHGKKIDIDSIPLDDEAVFAKLRAGDSVGVFQLEASSGMRDLLVQIRPTQMEDLIALVAIYRPGPMGSDEVRQYLHVRAGTDVPHYLVPELKPILEKTNGLIIYQEQVMQIARDLAGYSMAEADDLRKAIGKKKADLMAKHEVKFKDGWVKNNLDRDKADDLWTQIVEFASYAFNKSHAAAYAFITYQTAWLKTHYPIEYMCAVMISESGNQDDIIKSIADCKRMGIPILPPDINTSSKSFWITDEDEIRFGLGPIKNLGETPVADIIEERTNRGKFKTFKDFCERVDLSVINRLKLESLIKAGAFDEIGHNRASMLKAVEAIWEYRANVKSYESKLITYTKRKEAYDLRQQEISSWQKGSSKKKPSAIKEPVPPEKPVWPEMTQIDELPQFDIQSNERELLGFYVSSHPLDAFKDAGVLDKLNTIDEIKEMHHEYPVSLAAVITGITEITTALKKEKMAFLRIEDLTGTIEAVVFAKTYALFKHLLVEGYPIKLDGKVQVTEADEGKIVKLRVSKMMALNPHELQEKPQRLEAMIKLTRAKDLEILLKKYAGEIHEVNIILEAGDGTLFRLPSRRITGQKNKFLTELARINNE